MSGERKYSDIDAEAADWVVRLDGRMPTAAEQRALEEWLDKDARHLGAYARARAVYLRFDRMRATPVSARPETEVARGGFNPTRRKVLLWATGGTLAAAFSGLTLLRRAAVQEYSTRIGEMRRESLPDGSSITLNTGTTLAVSYTERLREVRLLCGEVLVEAAADPLRMFKLDVQGTSITTAAAAFAVRLLKHEGMQVMVQQGQVQVLEPSNRAKAVILPANTLALPPVAVGPQETDASLVAERIDPVEVERRLAWQRGQLSFEDVTLDYALQEFARYGAVRVVIDDPSIASLKVVGLYSSSDPLGFARAVSVSLGLRLEVREGIAHLKSA
jgi:transmembrane sensor